MKLFFLFEEILSHFLDEHFVCINDFVHLCIDLLELPDLTVEAHLNNFGFHPALFPFKLKIISFTISFLLDD